MPTLEKVSLTTVGYVILYVKDIGKTIPFYRDTLGIPLRHAEKNWAEFEVGGMTLALHQSDDLPPSHPSMPNVVFQCEDVRATHAALKEKGLKIADLHAVCEFDGKIGLSGDFKDPCGNRLSVYGLVPKADWAK